MRNKIAKRIKKQLIKDGIVFIEEKKLFEKNLPRKHCGYSAKVLYRGWTISTAEYDKLRLYKLIRNCIKDWDLGDYNND